jgi:low temperature requirement protein LtrA
LLEPPPISHASRSHVHAKHQWPSRSRRPLTTTEDQSATFIELFFDVVFVYAVTQTVSLVHEDLSWAGLGRAVVVFWLVWWAWTQYTWALNSADTAHPAVDAVMLVATAIAFLMAVTVPDAFGDAGLWFAASYIVVRTVGLGLYVRVAWDDVAKRAAVRKLAVFSLGGLAAVAAGGLVDGEARAWLWAAALLLDIFSAVVAGTAEGWDIRPDHFGERHGLIVIIALGESLIVAAAGLTGAELTAQTVAVAILAVSVTAALWWSYFVGFKPAVDEALSRREGMERTHFARDAYSFLHFPIVFGIVLLAVAIEEAVAHPHEPLPVGASVALVGGMVLFVGATAAVLRQGGYPLARMRLLILAAVAAAVGAAHGAAASWSLFGVVLGLLLLASAERPARATPR